MISFIIPVLNEEKLIKHLLQQFEVVLQSADKPLYEVILVDGGSQDSTLALASNYSFLKIVNSPPGRAKQLNQGAMQAQGELLCFVHADSGLELRFFAELEKALKQQEGKPFWGRFNIKLSSHRFAFRIIELFINNRSRLSGIATGDQAMFVHRSLFERVGGFPDIPLMEDVDLSKKLNKICQPLCLTHQITTSSRRWEENGIVKTVLLMWWLRFAFFVGISPQRLALLYRSKKPIDVENSPQTKRNGTIS